MEGACILRSQLDAMLPVHAVAKAGLNFKSAQIVPDLIVTFRGKTHAFVVSTHAMADDAQQQMGEVLDR